MQLYGGLLVFSGALLYDTAEVIEFAELTPARDPATGEDPYDPMVQSLNVYLDSMSIFCTYCALVVPSAFSSAMFIRY